MRFSNGRFCCFVASAGGVCGSFVCVYLWSEEKWRWTIFKYQKYIWLALRQSILNAIQQTQLKIWIVFLANSDEFYWLRCDSNLVIRIIVTDAMLWFMWLLMVELTSTTSSSLIDNLADKYGTSHLGFPHFSSSNESCGIHTTRQSTANNSLAQDSLLGLVWPILLFQRVSFWSFSPCMHRNGLHQHTTTPSAIASSRACNRHLLTLRTVIFVHCSNDKQTPNLPPSLQYKQANEEHNG